MRISDWSSDVCSSDLSMAEGRTMRKPRDYDSELKTLDDKARLLKQRQVQQLGEPVIATGANRLDIDVLAGALLDAATRDDLTIREEWRTGGAAFRSEEHKFEIQSLMHTSFAVF